MESTGGNIAEAIFDDASNFRLTNVTATVSDGRFNIGLIVGGPATTMTINQTTIIGPGGGGVGIVGENPGYVHIRNSLIVGRETIYGGGGGIRVVASQLDGGPTDGATICAGVYDENFTFYANTCP